MSEYVIECKGLSKYYGNIKSVNKLDLSISKGEIFGLLGPNGAGKTTTILLMMGLIDPTAGSLKVCGFDPTREPIKVKEKVGFLQDNMGFYNHLTAFENLRLIAALNDKDGDKKTIDEILDRIGLRKDRDRPVGEFSKGMKQRLGIGELLVKDSEVMILDEPTLGLDPEGIDAMLRLIKEIAENDGKTILISSHLLYQMQKICTRIGIFYQGSLVTEGSLEELADITCGQGLEDMDLERIYRKYFSDGEVRLYEPNEQAVGAG